MTGARPTGKNERGMILVVVLWAVAMMTVLVVALSVYAQKSLSLAGVDADRLRSGMALESGLDVGEAMIAVTKPEDRMFLDGTATTVDIGGERLVEVSVMDAAALVDINRASKDLLSGLGARLDVSADDAGAIVDAVVKLRDARQPKPAVGKQQALQQQQQQQDQQQQDQQQQGNSAAGDNAAPQPMPGIFFNTAQIYGLPGANPAAVNKMLPFIGLYSSDGKVNPMAAPQEIMQSIPGLTGKEAEVLMDARKSRQANDESVQDILTRYKDFIALREAKAFVIEVRAVSGRGLIAGSRLRAVVIVNAAGKPPFRILSWSW